MSADPLIRAISGDGRFIADTECVSCTPPENDPLTLGVSGHWKVLLHPDQTMPGALLIVSRRHVPKVGQLTTEEVSEFFVLYQQVEDALERVVGADMVNLSCLRNWAYRAANPEPPFQKGLPNPHVHWHVAPRFSAPVTIGDRTYVDQDFGEELRWGGVHLAANELRAVRLLVASALGLAAE